MGHRHSSAQLGGSGEVCFAAGGAGAPAAKRGRLAGWLLRRPVAALLLAAVRVYQVLFSPLVSTGCRFHPTCSRYAYEAIELHGARCGAWLALKRLLRCRPFVAGGYDPVPDPGERAAKVRP